jgi:hypothetical protein
MPTTSDLLPPTLRNRTQRCSQPCTSNMQSKLAQQTSAAAHVCTTDTDRLFITVKTSKRRFLIDTGSDLCVFPRKLIPQRRSGVNYDHCAANGTTIPTYGSLPLSLNLGLRRNTRIAICSGSRHTTPHRKTPTTNFQHL